MRGVRRWQEEESSEMKTPAALMEQVKSHPLDVDSDSEASFTSTLDNQADFQMSPGVPKSPKPPELPGRAVTEQKVKQQASSQTADFIASHTPTTLSNAQGMGASVQSLAHQVAFAAAKKAQDVSRNIEAAADTHFSQSLRANQSNETTTDQGQCQDCPSTPSRATGSLADITNSTYDIPPRMAKKLQMTGQNGTDFRTATLEHAAVGRAAEAKGFLAFVFHWTISTLYYSSGEYVVVMHLL
ncbi:hypothetical protein ABBQ32_010573 [Trebouxia sp. C0010 RCD-2024]